MPPTEDGFALAWPRLNRIAIWGVGLIGGSLGQAWRQAGVAAEVVGIGRDAALLADAVRYGTIDRYVLDPAEVLGCSDLLVLAAPVDVICRWAAEYGPQVAPGTVVTDVASLKAPVVAAWEQHLAAGAYFIGGHPMAGKEQTGAAHATPTLCQGARWVLTPGSRTTPEVTGLMTALARMTGAQVISMAPEQHDARVAYISHLPQLVSVALAAAAGQGERLRQQVLALAAGGFRDTTRIAASSPEMWWPIVLENQEAIAQALMAFRQELAALEGAIEAGDQASFNLLFARAAEVRHRAVGSAQTRGDAT